MTNILVTGGAGYIGSHACKALRAAGYEPVTYDSLVTGWSDAVKFGPFEQGDLLDRARLDAVFAKYEPIAVMHFAALSLVGESMTNPGLYWRNNVEGSRHLIEAAVEADGGADPLVRGGAARVAERGTGWSRPRLCAIPGAAIADPPRGTWVP